MFDISSNMEDLALLLKEKVKDYTMNDSSSVTVETAQQLMNSILYCINGYLNSIDSSSSIVSSTGFQNAINLYEKGLILENKNLDKVEELLESVKNNALKIDNLSYQDTIFNGLEVFFNSYDVEYAAHESAGDIDYQLCIEVEGLSGVEYVLKYLERLQNENVFCTYFNVDDIRAILKGYSKDYKEMLLNIFEIVLQNVLGLMLLGKNILILSIDNEQKHILQQLLENLDLFELQEKLLLALNDILRQLGIKDKKQIAYMKKATLNMSYNIKHCFSIKKLDKIFVTADYSEDIEEENYKDGIQMNDKDLRKFISKMQDCKTVSEKIEMMKVSIHSLSDYIDILDTCIWDDEYEHVFKLLNEIELKLLIKQVVSVLNSGISLNDMKDWQKALVTYAKM